MNKLKETDCCIIHGWMLRLTVTQDNKTRHLSINELIVFAKLFGFLQDGKETCICRVSQEYLEKWAVSSRKTIYTILQTLQDNGYINIIQQYTKNNQEINRHNLYQLNATKMTETIKAFDDSKSLVKNTSALCINSALLNFLSDNQIKTYNYILYSLIQNYSSDGTSFFSGSDDYIKEWFMGADNKIIRRARNYLLEAKLIEYKKLPGNKGIKQIYWTTASRESNNGQNYPHKIEKDGQFYSHKNNISDNFTHTNGQNYSHKRTDLPTTSDNFTQLNSSEIQDINLSLEKEVVEKRTTTTFSFEKYFNNTILEKLPNEASFKKRFIIWFNAHNDITQEKLEAYLSFTVEKFLKKENQTPGLFIIMFFSDSDFDSFSKKYDQDLEKQRAEQEKIKNNTVICPVCKNNFLKQNGLGVCSHCGLEEIDLNNQSVINEKIKYINASDEEKAEMDKLYNISLEKVFESFQKFKKPEIKENVEEQKVIEQFSVHINPIYISEFENVKNTYIQNGYSEQGAISKAQADLVKKYSSDFFESI